MDGLGRTWSSLNSSYLKKLRQLLDKNTLSGEMELFNASIRSSLAKVVRKSGHLAILMSSTVSMELRLLAMALVATTS